ncbi:Panacea domain-containing protein [Deinococcus aquatilis]|jgi:uncharacterized phage-associated protein|uniref:Panacea domain-containing protein n=1 Tax=Deinococcus aquatilis TaxID=519440 RepID=UPI00036B31F0|nr:type II toxin-antitoxin system antitoxin SocA domain-containing protein [Deinococcus aquatilis]
MTATQTQLPPAPAYGDPARTGYAAEVVANTFLELAQAEGRTLTQMQINKLVFIAHGWALALLGRPLTYNTFHAWQRGPVARRLWEYWRTLGRQPIRDPLPVSDAEPRLKEDEDALNLIRGIWATYGQKSGEELSNLTHLQGSPWAQTYGLSNDLIPNEITREYYVDLLRGA